MLMVPRNMFKPLTKACFRTPPSSEASEEDDGYREEKIMEGELEVLEECMDVKETDNMVENEKEVPKVNYMYTFVEVSFLMYKLGQMARRRTRLRETNLKAAAVSMEELKNSIEKKAEKVEKEQNVLIVNDEIMRLMIMTDNMDELTSRIQRKKTTLKWKTAVYSLKVIISANPGIELSLVYTFSLKFDLLSFKTSAGWV